MAITGFPPAALDPVAQVVAALEAATAALEAAGGGGAASLLDRGSWVTSTAYAVGDVATQAGQRYACRTAHTAGTFATDLAASKWVSLDAVAAAASSRLITAGTGLTGGGDLAADRTLAVAYGATAGTAAQGNDSRVTGALQASNNLSDVTAVTARTNLGLGTAATLATSAVAQTANNLSDLASATTARTNLGLGGAATLSVGTTTGTVAAGDDSRIIAGAAASTSLYLYLAASYR